LEVPRDAEGMPNFDLIINSGLKIEKGTTFVVKEQVECSICTLDFEHEEEVSQLECHELHIFHKPCIDAWITKSKDNPLCPYCRAEIPEDSV
jgi:hypothetical protein